MSLFIVKVVPALLLFGLLSIASLGFSFSIVSVSFSDSLVSCRAIMAIPFCLISIIRSLYLDFLLEYHLPLMFREAMSRACLLLVFLLLWLGLSGTE